MAPMTLYAKRLSGIFSLALLAPFVLIAARNAQSDPPDNVAAAVEVAEVSDRPTIARLDPARPLARDTVELVRQAPQALATRDTGVVLVDFGQVAFGNIELTAPAGFTGQLTVRFGEKLAAGSIDRQPPGTVRYSEVHVKIDAGEKMVIAPPADERNTQQSFEARRPGGPVTPPAVLTPPEWGVITPFRWVELEGLPNGLTEDAIVRQAAYPKHWNETSAAFVCSDETLNRVWELCRYSIKATMFAGVYVDGDRERIPYEADAYLNQLSHYYVDHDPSMARLTFDWLTQYPTWPTEWGPHMVFMAHAEWLRSGDVDWVADRYEALKGRTLADRVQDTHLVHSNEKQMGWNDIVDWPPSERDGYVRGEINTVVNAFHVAAIDKMAELAEAIGAAEDARNYKEQSQQKRAAFNRMLFDEEAGLYRDGAEIDHHSIHANFFPLAFNLVEAQHRPHVVKWLAERGMRCSPYAGQYLLEGLFENGAGEAAVGLILAPGKRSWRHMLDSGATITWESWNEKVKPNLDWNHAWGAAPANLLPRFVLGVQPLSAGWQRARIRPNTSGLSFARGVTPTPLGKISIEWTNEPSFEMEVKLPAGMTAVAQVPHAPKVEGVLVNGQPVKATLVDGFWLLAEEITGESKIQARKADLHE
jgi:hypothetical protein